jgi:UDP-GlcNAc:undecaprenyl-phosphate GlcNAc-1-phosphate transferase
MTTSLSATFPLFQGLLLSLLIVLIFALLSIRLTRYFRLIDVPGREPHKRHSHPIPMAGGIAMFLTLLLTGWLLNTFSNPDIFAAYWAVIPIFIFGIWDDFKNISPLLKLIGQVIAALILIRLGVAVRIFESPEFFLHGSERLNLYLDWLITILWVVGITNAYNFVDSMDGLALGLGGTAAAFFVLVTLDAQQPLLSQHSAIILGACLGLYLFNSPPALLFLGDSGSQMLGFFLAILAINYNPQGANQSSSWFVPILLLGVPIFDAALVILSRLRWKRPIYLSALDHTYHRLVNLGLQSNRAVLLMQVAAFILSCLAFLTLRQPPLIANAIYAILICMGGCALVFLDHPKFWK